MLDIRKRKKLVKAGGKVVGNRVDEQDAELPRRTRS